MPVENLAPTGNGSVNWNFSGAATAWQTLLTDDGNTSTLNVDINNLRSRFTFGAPSLPVGGISSMKVYARAKSSDGSTGAFKGYYHLGGTDSDGGAHTPTPAGTYGSFTSGAISRPGGGTWAAGDLASAQFGYLNFGPTNPRIDITHGYAVIDYAPVGGGFITMILHWLGYVPVALAIRDVAGVAAEILRRSSGALLIRPDEYLALLREVREARRPAYMLPAVRRALNVPALAGTPSGSRS